jgi:2-dehydro-3-deoxyglucarate aldolase
MRNDLRATLRKGLVAFGSWISIGHTAVAEIMAQAGFDWLAVDLEHSAIGIESVQALIQVIELSGCVPLVRLSSNDPVLAKRVMDAGAHGVIVPSVNSPEEALAAVRAVKYPPLGSRGVGLARAQGYGARFHEYVRELETYGIVVVMIEHRTGLEQAERILAVPGVDCVFVGPYDLSASLGIAGDFEHPTMLEAQHRLVAAARAAGVAAGIHVVHPSVDQVKRRLMEGFTFVAFGVDQLFLGAPCREAVPQLRALAGGSGAAERRAG